MTPNPEWFMKRNLDFIKANPELFSGDFGPSRIQRHGKIGYNQAMHTIEAGLSNGVLEKGSEEWLVRLTKGKDHE